MKKILLIEDDHTLRENLEELLELAGYEVKGAPNGKIGLEMALAQPPHLIMCDIMMPVMDGYEVYNQLVKKKKTRNIPFIFLSAKSNPEDIRKGMKLGADDYLTKPIKEQDLLDAIESRLARCALLRKNKEENEEETAEGIATLAQLRSYFKEHGEYLEVDKNQHIYKEQKNAYYLYLLQEGLVKTHRMDAYSKELITGLYRKNDLLGFYNFKKLSPYPETATSLEPGILFRLKTAHFLEILHQNQSLSIELAQFLSDNLSTLKSNLLEMAYASVLKKTTNTILQFVELMADESNDGIKISRSDLASVAGISTESFIRSLSSLKKEGLIDIEGRNIKVLNLNKLKNIK